MTDHQIAKSMLRELDVLCMKYLSKENHNDYTGYAVIKLADFREELERALDKPAREYVVIETPCFPNSFKVVPTRFGEIQDYDNSSNLYFSSFAEAQAEANKRNEKLKH